MARLVSAAARKPACLAPRQCVNIIAHSLLSLSRSLSFLPSPSSERGILHRMERPPAGRPPRGRARSPLMAGRKSATNEQTTFLLLLRPSNHPTIPGAMASERASRPLPILPPLHWARALASPTADPPKHSTAGLTVAATMRMRWRRHAILPSPRSVVARSVLRSVGLAKPVFPSHISSLSLPKIRSSACARPSERPCARDVTKNVSVVRKCLDHPRKGERRKEGRQEGEGGRKERWNSLDSPHTNRGLLPLPGLQAAARARFSLAAAGAAAEKRAAEEEACEENGFAFVCRRRFRRRSAHCLTDAYLHTQVWSGLVRSSG